MSTEKEQRLKQQVKEDAKSHFEKLKAMTRNKLLKMYEDITGVVPHPRTQKNWLVMALARFHQSKLYGERLGYVPSQVAQKDLEFFMSNRLYMVSKERAKIEKQSGTKSKSKTKNKEIVVSKTPAIFKITPDSVDIKDRYLRAKKQPNPYEEEPLQSFYNQLIKSKVMSFTDIQRWCEKQNERVLPIYVFQVVIRDGNADWLMCDEEGIFYAWNEVDVSQDANVESNVNKVVNLKENFSVDKHFESRISDEQSEEIVGDHAPTKEDRAMLGKTIRKDRDLRKIEPDFDLDEDDFEEGEFCTEAYFDEDFDED